MLALQASHTVLEAFIVAIIERALVGFSAVVIVVVAVLLELRLFELEHELRESLVDDGLVLVVLVEDELGEV